MFFTTQPVPRPNLAPGHQGMDVAVLQFQLRQFRDKHRLIFGVEAFDAPYVDGVFERHTHEAVMKFQRLMGIYPSGVANPDTRKALSSKLSGYGVAPPIVVDHNITLVTQPTDWDCWAAATAMMTGLSVKDVFAKTPNNIRTQNPGNSIWGDMYDALTSRRSGGPSMGVESGKGIDERFASTFNFRQYAPMTWTVSAFREELRKSPLMLAMLSDREKYLKKESSMGHAVVISAMVSDNSLSGSGTYIMMLDPWPDPYPGGKGQVLWNTFDRLYQLKKLTTYQVFSRK